MTKITERQWKKLKNDCNNTHQIWWDFCLYFTEWYYKEIDNIDSETYEPIGTKHKEFDSNKMVGYEAMMRVEEYSKTHPDIKIIPVDDGYYSSSDIVLIPHPNHGITMIYISQNAPENNLWFLYPGYIKILQTELNKMKKKYNLTM